MVLISGYEDLVFLAPIINYVSLSLLFQIQRDGNGFHFRILSNILLYGLFSIIMVTIIL